MQLPAVVRTSFISMPPIYTWPQSIKRVLLFSAISAVIVAYALLGGGIIALFAILVG